MRPQLLFFLLFLLVFNCIAQQQPLFNVSVEKAENAEATLAEVKQTILDNYYYDGITPEDLDWAAIEGILRHVSPPEAPELAKLWTDEEYEKILNSLKGIKVSLGFMSSFNSSDGSLTVTSLTDGSEAAQKLQVSDRILRIDDQVLKGKRISDVNELLDGELNQIANLTVVRDIQVFEVTLRRDSLAVENLVITRIPNRKVALVEIRKVVLGLAGQLQAELEKLKSEGITSIILDLRNNSGGVLNEGINIARLFLKKNNIVLRTQKRSEGITNYVADQDQFYDLNVALLINEQTASAAEIICSALQDHGRAILVGKKTYGKGVIETTFTLQNNFRLKFITNAMYSPKGISWQSKGLLPDYFVDQSQGNYEEVVQLHIDDRMRNDLHLSTALRLLGR